MTLSARASVLASVLAPVLAPVLASGSLLAVAALSSGCGPSSPRVKISRAADPKPLPASLVTPLDGGAPLAVDEVVRGKVAVIDLWASWCTACRPVSARVAKLAEAHAGDPSLAVIGVDAGEEAAAVRDSFAGKAPPVPTYLDPSFGLADALGTRELPAVVVVDRRGRVISVTKKLDAAVVRLVEDELAAPSD